MQPYVERTHIEISNADGTHASCQSANIAYVNVGQYSGTS